MRAAWLIGLAAALVACGGSTGVRDAGKPPPVAITTHAVQLWFIRPGGRVGVERDLVPVTVQIRGYPDQLPRLALRALEHGPSARLRLAGYRSVVGCCAGMVERPGGGDPASRMKQRLSVRQIDTGSWTAVSVQDPPFTRLQLASATQVIRTLGALPGVGRVDVLGITREYLGGMSDEMAQGEDQGHLRPHREASCDLARHGGGMAVGVTHTDATTVTVHVRATAPVSIEFSQGRGALVGIVDATAAPCGVWNVTFPGASVQYGRLIGTMAFRVRVTPLAGPATPGVTRQFTLRAPKAIASGA